MESQRTCFAERILLLSSATDDTARTHNDEFITYEEQYRGMECNLEQNESTLSAFSPFSLFSHRYSSHSLISPSLSIERSYIVALHSFTAKLTKPSASHRREFFSSRRVQFP